MKVILGVDPGSRITGFGLIQVDRDRIRHLDHGIINVSSIESFHQRITLIGQELRKLIQELKPDWVAVEKIFLGKNADSAFKLGHARGVILYESHLAQVQISEYATRIVKKSVTGRGEASKEEVQAALTKLLQIKIGTKIDASDALALAYHHAIQLEINRKLSSQRSLHP